MCTEGLYCTEGKGSRSARLNSACPSHRYNDSLLEEGKMMHRLKHQRVVKLLGVIMEDGNYALVMEYMEKGNLMHVLKAEVGGAGPRACAGPRRSHVGAGGLVFSVACLRRLSLLCIAGLFWIFWIQPHEILDFRCPVGGLAPLSVPADSCPCPFPGPL